MRIRNIQIASQIIILILNVLFLRHCFMTHFPRESNEATKSIFEDVVTKVTFSCSRCVPKLSESSQNPPTGKLFETFSSLKRHNEFYHNFEVSPDLLFEERESESFLTLCDICQKLCLSSQSYSKHMNLDHNQERAKKANQFLSMIMEFNKGAVDQRIQRQEMVESILKFREEDRTKVEAKATSNKSGVWETKGDPEAYDIDKVLKELNEVCA